MVQLSANPGNTPYNLPWKTTCTVGRGNELLRDDVLTHLRKAQRDIGFRYIRFHALFHDDMHIVHRKKDDTLAFEWHQMDKVYDALLEMGLRPLQELSSMPKDMASGDKKACYFRFGSTPPKDWDEWEQFIEAYARHIVDRYGLDEVRRWYFEVWNEPNLRGGFWTGTREEYWTLYERSARALKRVDDQLRVGGPASALAEWVPEIIEMTQERGLPLDFVSTHSYQQDEYQLYKTREESPHKDGYYFIDKIREVKKQVEDSKRPDLEIHWTEWNPMAAADPSDIHWGENLCNDALYAAAFICHATSQTDDSCDSLAYWIVSDVFDEWPVQNAPFSATYGMMTIHGHPKSSYNAFRLLAKLRGPRMDIGGELPEYCGAMATEEAGVQRLVLWNYETLERRAKQPVWEDAVEVSADSERMVVTAKITKGQGSSWETWKRMGMPLNISTAEEERLRFASEPLWEHQLVEADGHKVKVPFKLEPNEVLYMEIRPRGEKAWNKGTQKDTFSY